MSKKTNSKKIKIIQFKDVVSLLVIVVILFCSFTYTFGGITRTSNASYAATPTYVTANTLYKLQNNTEHLHDTLTGIPTEKNVLERKVYKLLKSNNLNELKFAEDVFYNIKDCYYYYKNDARCICNTLFTDEGYLTSNYTNVGTILADNSKFPMAAVTYVREDAKNIDIVISYRSTISGKGFNSILDALEENNEKNKEEQKTLTEILKETVDKCRKEDTFENGNWGQDIFAIFFGYTGMETDAQLYAENVAKYYIKRNDNKKKLSIHLTGQSLGGYLAQIGGAALLQNNTYKNYVKQIGYFNGFGLYKDNKFANKIIGLCKIYPTKVLDTLEDIASKMDVQELNFLKDYDKTNFKKIIKKLETTTQRMHSLIQKAYNTLSKKENSAKVTLYRAKGDLVSALGHHAGNIKEFYASNSNIENRQAGYNADMANELKSYIKTAYVLGLLKIDFSQYPELYKVSDPVEYMWATHYLKSMDGYDLTKDMKECKVEIKFYGMPWTLKKGKTANVTLDIKLTNAVLDNTLQKSFFSTSSGISISSIKKISEIKNRKEDSELHYTSFYTYIITIKANRLSVAPTMRLESNALPIISTSKIKNLPSFNINNGNVICQFNNGRVPSQYSNVTKDL